MSLDPIKYQQKKLDKVIELKKIEIQENIPQVKEKKREDKIKKKKSRIRKVQPRIKKGNYPGTVRSPLDDFNESDKKRIMWILVVIAMAIIFIFWLYIFPPSLNFQIAKNSKKETQKTVTKIWEELKDIWSSLRNNLPESGKEGSKNLNLNKSLTNQEIKNLEEKIFQ